MKVVILNGSPKGKVTITMQYVHFLELMHPEHEYSILNISERISRLDGSSKKMGEAMEIVGKADLILWCTPVYYFLIPSQLKRFIELIHERDCQPVFKDKFTAVLTTSVHFFDHCAHNYLHAVCDDLQMKYVGMFSPDMDDLLTKKGRTQLTKFAQSIFQAVENDMAMAKAYLPLRPGSLEYSPGSPRVTVDNGDLNICIVADKLAPGNNLQKMVNRLWDAFSKKPTLIQLDNLKLLGGCRGCVRCGYNHECLYEDKDDFIEFFKATLMPADILIFAGEIRDRFLSSLWKQYFDRSFFRNHTPAFMDRQIGWIVSGPLTQLPNLRQVLEAYTEFQKANPVDFVTDEVEASGDLDNLLDSFAQRMVRYARMKYVRPSTFLGIGGGKLFRDEVWGRFRFPFRADYTAYKQNNWFDFPDKRLFSRMKNNLLLTLSRIPAIRKQIYIVDMKEKMTALHRKVIEKNLPNPKL